MYFSAMYRLRWYRKAFLSYGASYNVKMAKTSLHTHTAVARLPCFIDNKQLHLNVVSLSILSFTWTNSLRLCLLSGVYAVVCHFGFHGRHCSDRCSPHCSEQKCFRNATCVGGCQPGWTGHDCETGESFHRY